MSKWLEIIEMVSTFVAIHAVVKVIDETIHDNERFYYDAFLFPLVTLLSFISVVSARWASSSDQ